MNSETNPRFNLILFAAVAILSAAAGFSLWQLTGGRAVDAQLGSRDSVLLQLPEPRVIADFALVDDEARPFSLDDLRGRWSLLFFGFTHCPDVCPTALYELQRVSKAFAGDTGSGTPAPQIVFVSVDPERDSPSRLREYVDFFDPGFTGVTGPHEQLAPLTRQLGIAYRIEEHDPEDRQYGVDHSVGILLTDPQGRLRGVFPAPHDADRIAGELIEFIDAQS